jgi:hypothetical protein
MAKRTGKIKKKRKSRKDTNQVAFDIVNKIAKDPAAQSLGRRGGMARKARLTKEELTEIGRKGAKARWDKRDEKLIVFQSPS